jgi:hypothetical protein
MVNGLLCPCDWLILKELCNEEPAMRNLIIDGAAGGETKRCHFSSVDVAPRKRSCTFFYRIFFKKKTFFIPVSCRFFIRRTDDILRTLLLMHDGVSFDRIQPKQVGYFGT